MTGGLFVCVCVCVCVCVLALGGVLELDWLGDLESPKV
jgi:hypothetical protein